MTRCLRPSAPNSTLMFPVIALAAGMAFSNSTLPQVNGFFRMVALLLIPTVFTAVLELRLPPTHWLNLSVGGDSLEGFSAGGRLRVSSTFAFVAQFVMFLNAQMYVLALPLLAASRVQSRWTKTVYYSLIPALLIGMFITGSRGAVLANFVMIAIAGALLFFSGRRVAQALPAMVALALVGYLVFLGLKQIAPDFFVAYDMRSADTEEHTQNQEMAGRVSNMFFGWLENPVAAPTVFGRGLGVMSNGADKLSAYAASWRSYGRWTETDMATTLFEGGFYLIFVWMGFRLYVVGRLMVQTFKMPADDMFLPAVFVESYIVLIGITATLGIQPPMSIWFWMAVGLQSALTADGAKKSLVLEPEAPLPLSRGLRGRSAYAERLHAQSVE